VPLRPHGPHRGRPLPRVQRAPGPRQPLTPVPAAPGPCGVPSHPAKAGHQKSALGLGPRRGLHQ
jgi:hypothetical protein